MHPASGPGRAHRPGAGPLPPRARSALNELQSLIAAAGLGPAIEDFRERVPQTTALATARIQREVPSYAGPAAGGRRRLIELAIRAALGHVVDVVSGGVGAQPRVDALFRQMGGGEARDRHTLEAMQAAVQIASRTIWSELRSWVEEHQLPTEVLVPLTELVFATTDHLLEETAEGHRAGARIREQDPLTQRSVLLDLLLRDSPGPLIQDQAERTGWPLPDYVLVWAVDTRGRTEPPPTGVEGHALMVHHQPGTTVLVGDAEQRATTLALLHRTWPGARVSVGWPVTPQDAHAAHDWVVRALQLVERGVLPRRPLLDCAEHRVQLWLHAEPVVRRQLCQQLLRPLLAETPNSREILSETLLTWLETRDSAPAIAARLGVHPQTVRYRWKRINELFGESLHDPEFVVQLTMVLKASVPLWKAGDQSDFERFRSQGGDA